MLEDFAVATNTAFGELTIEVAPQHIVAAMAELKAQKFEQLTSVTGVDRYPAEPRFEVVYHVHSFAKKERVRVKVRLSGEHPQVESVCSVYSAANWYERETYDFYGVTFVNHPDLRRIMLPDEWEGYPLRKDAPTTGTRY